MENDVAARAEFELAFGVQASAPETVAELRAAGFVQVRGLQVGVPYSKERSWIESGKDVPRRWLGRYDTSNGLVVWWAPGGECWVAVSMIATDGLAWRLARGSKGAHVPFSNMEQISPYDLLHRVANPYWIPYEVRREIMTRTAAEPPAAQD